MTSYFRTPYNTDLRPVTLQAQMVSQIISAALDDRPLLWVWKSWQEIAWIYGWL